MHNQPDFLKAAAAAEAAANATTSEEEMAAVMQILDHKEAIQIALANKSLARMGGPMPGHERKPLLDEDGYDYGRVEARIPKALFYGLQNQKNFGEAGLYSEDGIKDVLKAFPQCRVKTVSGKIQSGWRAARVDARPTRNRVKFGRGTIQLAT